MFAVKKNSQRKSLAYIQENLNLFYLKTEPITLHGLQRFIQILDYELWHRSLGHRSKFITPRLQYLMSMSERFESHANPVCLERAVLKVEDLPKLKD
jgi:hypothetical protein